MRRTLLCGDNDAQLGAVRHPVYTPRPATLPLLRIIMTSLACQQAYQGRSPMLSELFESPARIRAILGGPAGVQIEAFAEQLFQCGYSKIVIRRHIRSAEHIVRWATRRSLSPHALGGQAFKRFVDHLGRCRCGRYHCANRVDVVSGARLFLSHLQGVKEPPARDRQLAPAEPVLLKEFCAWMRERRGTSDGALYNQHSDM